MEWASGVMELLWLGGLAATPLAILVGMICRLRSIRPATRHTLWLAALVSFITPVVGAAIWRPDWFQSKRVIAAADVVLKDRVASSGSGGGSGSTLRPAVERPEPVEAAIERDPPLVADLPSTKNAEQPVPAHPAPSPRPVVSRPIISPAPVVTEVAPGQVVACEPVVTAAPRVDRPATSAVAKPSSAPGSRVSTASGPLMRSHSGKSDSAPSRASLEMDRTDRPSPKPIERSGPYASDSRSPLPKPVKSHIEIERGSQGAAAAEASSEAQPAIPAVPASVATPSPMEANVRAWIASIVKVRDSIAALPPIPTPVWLGVAGMLVLFSLTRAIMTARWVRRARPAGEEVDELVRGVAGQLGLRRAPSACIVDSAISPMIWCGLHPRLILPGELWGTLDEDSQRAVVAHELAHLRRRDHMLCWLESVIGAMYWWHPVAWWARHRLHDEAEASCDAWVTSLFPAGRRAYAAALVTTKSFLSSASEPSAGPCLGIMSGSAKKLARRITMVMTQRTAPKMSVVGVCVAAIVIAAGMFVTPGLACPPEEGAKSAKKAPAVIIRKGKADKHGAEAPAVPFLGEAPALEAMKGEKAQKAKKAEKASKERAYLGGATLRGLQVHPTPAPEPGVATTLAYPSGQNFRAYSPASQPEVVDLEALKVGRTPQEYALPEGKLNAFYELMSRNDVPILVQMQGDHIIVWGNASEHKALGAFIKMINPKGGKAGGPQTMMVAPDGKLAEELALYASRAAQGEKVDKAALKDYARAIEELRASRDAMEADADAQRDAAEQMRERADRIRELSQELRDRAQEVQEEEQVKQALEQAYKRLSERSDALHDQSHSMDNRVQQLIDRIAEIERRAEELEDQLAMLDDEDFDLDEAEIADVEEIDFIEPVEVIPAPAAPTPEAPAAPEAPFSPTAPTPDVPPAPPAPPVAPTPEASGAPSPAPADDC
ncbi:MAG: hypothetical protein IT435_01540 [Phycisphaerales bacterium]|nr:hypothetical protein [Phycisphaerales bacterium]